MADQKITGVPGSPSATTTLDGKQLPPPPPKFGGVIKESAKDSTPWWAPRVVPPKGAPNVLLIMTDDQGYGVSSTFRAILTNFPSFRLSNDTRQLLGWPSESAFKLGQAKKTSATGPRTVSR